MEQLSQLIGNTDFQFSAATGIEKETKPSETTADKFNEHQRTN